MYKNPSLVTTAACLATLSFSAFAKVSPEEAAKLDNELTPVGAIRAGNAEGTIPAWTGGITGTPEGITYKVGDFHPDPFADEKPLFTITSANYKEYADKLSAGHQGMFEKYSDYKMDIYPTHRTAAFPEWVYESSKYNALNAELVSDENLPGGKPNMYSPRGAKHTSPFPIPKSGAEAILNHTFRYTGDGLKEDANQLVVAENGDWILAEIKIDRTNYYSDRTKSAEELAKTNLLNKAFQFAIGPARIAGGVIAAETPMTPSFTKAWSYNPGQRRVRRAPQIAYDNPGTGSDGLRFTDNLSGFLGSIDRYSWELKGREEFYIPYNSYVLHSDQTKYNDIVRKGHINQDLARYELHRVWVIDSHVRPGTSHAVGHRTDYIDEDSWNIMLVDLYDKRDQLWRLQEEHRVVYWEVPVLGQTLEVVNDLAAARYICMGADNESNVAIRDYRQDESYYKPASLKGRAKR